MSRTIAPSIRADISNRTWRIVALGIACLAVGITRQITEPRAFDTLRVIAWVAGIALLLRTGI